MAKKLELASGIPKWLKIFGKIIILIKGLAFCLEGAHPLIPVIYQWFVVRCVTFVRFIQCPPVCQIMAMEPIAFAFR